MKALSDTKEGEEQVLRSVNGRPSSATRRIEREENACKYKYKKQSNIFILSKQGIRLKSLFYLVNKRPMSAKDPMQKVKRNSRKPKESYFFTEESSKQGAIGEQIEVFSCYGFGCFKV